MTPDPTVTVNALGASPSAPQRLAEIVARRMLRACAEAEGFYQTPGMSPDWDVDDEVVIRASLIEWRDELRAQLAKESSPALPPSDSEAP